MTPSILELNLIHPQGPTMYTKVITRTTKLIILRSRGGNGDVAWMEYGEETIQLSALFLCRYYLGARQISPCQFGVLGSVT